MSDHLTPVEVCERLIGPLPVLERIAGYRPKAGYGWRRSSQERQAGDFPGTRIQRAMLAYAAARGIPLTADHLIFGASVEDIDALMTAATAEAAE